MPWRAERSDRCPASRPWGVVNTENGDLVACHDSEESAQAQVRALFANVPEARRSDEGMKFKTFRLLETKADEESGTFTALASVFGNVDRGGDRMLKGAFKKTLDDWRKSGDPIPIVLSHQHDDPFAMIGKADPRAVFEDEDGLRVQGQLDLDNPTAKQVHKLMVQRLLKGWSFGYKVAKGGQRRAKDGANEVSEVELFEVGPTLVGMNPEARLEAVKALPSDSTEPMEPDWDERPEELKAVWSTAFVNNLPDSSFLYIESGGEKDSDGKTTPRSLRHFPVKNADGTPDPAHVRNALARIPQSNLPQSVKDRCTAAARRMLNAMGSSDETEEKVEQDSLKQESREAQMGVMRDGLPVDAAPTREQLDELRAEIKRTGEEIEKWRQLYEDLKASEVRRNEEAARPKSPPDPLKQESRKAVLAVMRDGVPAHVERSEPEPEPEPPIDIRRLRRESRRAQLSVLKGGIDGE